MKLTLESIKKDPSKLARFGMVRIWSGEHRAWWGPDSRGYFIDIEAAGIYTAADAFATTRHACRKKKIVFFSADMRSKKRNVLTIAAKMLEEKVGTAEAFGIATDLRNLAGAVK